MNILVVTPWFPNSASEQEGSFVLASVDALVAEGHRVQVLVTRPWVPRVLSRWRPHSHGSPDATITSRGFTVSVVTHLSIPRDRLRVLSNRLYQAHCAGAVRGAMRVSRADVVHAHTEGAGVLACAVAGHSGVPVVTTIHGINDSPRYLHGAGQQDFLRRAYGCPDRLVLVGERLRPFVTSYGARAESIRVVANGFDAALAMPFRQRTVLNAKVIRLVSVSNLVDGKGIETTLRALALESNAGWSKWHYDVVGDGPLRAQIEALVRQLGIAGRVTFHGRCTRARVFELLSQADVFCLPSAPEAFGIAYLEAMACGLLAIGCRGEGPEGFIRDGITGWLVGARGAVELAQRLRSIASDPSSHARIAAAGRESAWAGFTWQAHGRALESVLASVLAGNARA